MGDNFKNIKKSNIVNRSNINTRDTSHAKKTSTSKKDNLKQLLKENKLTLLLEKLEVLLVKKNDKEQLNDLILIESNFKKLQKSYQLQLLSNNEYTVGESKFKKSLLEIISNIQE
jgi:hypothetical protein